MEWNLLQSRWFGNPNVRQPKPPKEKYFVDHSGISVFTGTKEQCQHFRKENGGIIRRYVGTSEEYRSQLREEKRFQYTGSGRRQDIQPDVEPGVIWMNGSCYKTRRK